MEFIQELDELLGISNSNDICVTFMVGSGAVVYGYKKLLEISDEKLIVLGKNKRKLRISGKNLAIKSLAPSEIVIKGKIVCAEELNE